MNSYSIRGNKVPTGTLGFLKNKNLTGAVIQTFVMDVLCDFVFEDHFSHCYYQIYPSDLEEDE